MPCFPKKKRRSQLEYPLNVNSPLPPKYGGPAFTRQATLVPRAVRYRAGMPGPDLASADQRDADIAAQPQCAVGLQSRRSAVGVAVVGIVDPAILPAAGFHRLEPGHEHQPAERPVAQLGLGIGGVEPLLVRVARLYAEPQQAAAQRFAARASED